MNKLPSIDKRTLFFPFFKLKAAHKEIASYICLGGTSFGSFFSL